MRICTLCDLRDIEPARTRCLVCGGELVECIDPRIGTVLGGRYRLEAVIGVGGMATVYRARHTLMERPYAVKILHHDLVQDERLVERMRREARSTAALTHPNIIEIYDFGMTADEAPYLVMELVGGVPLRAILKGNPIPLPHLIELGVQMARGLARAHDFEIVHRDLKPENVFVGEEAGQPLVKIVDFGIARSHHDTHLTNKGEVVGTPQYMAPERALTRDVAPACDLYSLGVVLFELATGTLPFRSKSPTGYVLKHLHEAPPRPSALSAAITPELEALILELLAKDPTRRPVDAHQVVDRLQAMQPKKKRAAQTSRPVPASGAEHTATFDAWMQRAALVEHLVALAYPNARPPSDVVEHLSEIRDALARMRELREEGVRAQRELDVLARESRDASEQLGHAVHVLAKDLSRAREEARTARDEAKALADAPERARLAFVAALDEVTRIGLAAERASPELVQTSQSLGAAAIAWQLEEATLARASMRAELAEAAVSDVDFQAEELRRQLARLEASIAERGTASRALLEQNGADRKAVELLVAELTQGIAEPLRERADLAEVFVALDGTAPRARAVAS